MIWINLPANWQKKGIVLLEIKFYNIRRINQFLNHSKNNLQYFMVGQEYGEKVKKSYKSRKLEKKFLWSEEIPITREIQIFLILRGYHS